MFITYSSVHRVVFDYLLIPHYALFMTELKVLRLQERYEIPRFEVFKKYNVET